MHGYWRGHCSSVEKTMEKTVMNKENTCPHRLYCVKCIFHLYFPKCGLFIKCKIGSPAQVGCMRQALRRGALGRPRGSGWRGRWEGGSGWGTHVNPWLFHFNVWQNPLQIKKKLKKNIKKNTNHGTSSHTQKKQDRAIKLNVFTFSELKTWLFFFFFSPT